MTYRLIYYKYPLWIFRKEFKSRLQKLETYPKLFVKIFINLFQDFFLKNHSFRDIFTFILNTVKFSSILAMNITYLLQLQVYFKSDLITLGNSMTKKRNNYLIKEVIKNEIYLRT